MTLTHFPLVALQVLRHLRHPGLLPLALLLHVASLYSVSGYNIILLHSLFLKIMTYNNAPAVLSVNLENNFKI